MGESRRFGGRRLAGIVLAGVVLIGLSACAQAPAADVSTVTTIRAFLTGYSYFDNTPPGSAHVSHPIVHTVAGGRGTYDDPVTVAVGHVRDGGDDILDWPAGTRFYVPNLRRYLIVEDTCGDGERPQDGPCHTGYPAEAATWFDVWVGGEGGSAEGAERCMREITGVWDVVVNPEPNFAVDPGDIYAPVSDGLVACTGQYGDELVPAGSAGWTSGLSTSGA